MTDKRIALVTGANRGLGFETCRQLVKKGYEVILTSRDEEKGKQAADSLRKEGLNVIFHTLDITNTESIVALKQFVTKEFKRLDVLVNNAGIFLDREDSKTENASVFDSKIKTIQKTIETNTYGPLQMCQAFTPLMKQNGFGRVVNVSSGMGQLSEMNGHYTGYRLSKTALNAVTRIFADELEGTGVLVNSVCPGWVKTDMGGPNAERSIEKGVETIVWAATLPDGGPTGGFFRDRERIEW